MKIVIFAVIFTCLAVQGAFAQSPETARILAIQEQIGAGNLDAATELLKTALARSPEDGGLWNLRGVIRAQRGEFTDARADFEKAVALAPLLTAAWQNLARACQVDAAEKQTADCAERAWSRVSQQHPGDAEARRGLTLALEREGRYAESLRMLGHAPQDPSSLTADLMLQCLDLNGLKRKNEATEVAGRLAAQADFGEGDLEAMAGVDPPLLIALAEGLDARRELKLEGMKRLASAYAADGRLDDARKTLERCAQAEPGNAAHLLELARVAELQHDHEGALGYLGHARDLSPDDARVHYLFGVEAAKMELMMEAKTSFGRALELAPGNVDYDYAMGQVILTTRDAASAAGYFQKYVAARPADPLGHYALGVADFASGEYEKSRKEMDRVEGSKEVGDAAEFFLGRMDRLDGNLAGATKHFRRSIDLMPRFAESHTELARVLMAEERWPEADIELRRALALDPKSFQANLQLLVLYKRMHDERAGPQAELLKELDEARGKRAELMLRGVEVRPK